MGKKTDNYGMLISLLIHVLIMTIPVSMAVVQRFDEIELFVLNEERPVIQETKMVKKSIETPKVRREIEEPKKPIIEEKPRAQEEKIIEPTVASDRAEAIPLSTTESPDNPEAEAGEVASTPQSPSGAPGPREVEFGSAIGPSFLHREMPVYPVLARRVGKEGRVVLRLTIDEKGSLINIEVIENAGYGFTDAAIAAVKRSTFLPAKEGGKPIASRALLPVSFKLRRD